MSGIPELSADWRPGAGAAAAAGDGAGPSPAPGAGDHPRVEVGAVLCILRRLAVLPGIASQKNAPTAVEAKMSGVGEAVLEVCRHPIPLLAGAAAALLRRWQEAAVDRPLRLAWREQVRGQRG